MASYAYGGLQIAVTADTRSMEQAIRHAATGAGTDASKDISSAMQRGLSAIGGIAASVGKATATGLGLATVAAAGFGVEAYKTAARAGEMDATLRALASANNLSYDSMQQSVSAIRHQGIEAGVAQNLVAQFARNQLDLGRSTDLARVAQDAAVISGQNSSDTLDQLIHGITTQNSLVLRNAGINVNAGQAMDEYAKSIGKSRNELNESERAQAVLNAVIQSGTSIAGSYAAAMEEPGKVLRSYPRIIDDVKLSFGGLLLDAFGPIIIKGYELIKTFSAAIAETGKFRPVMEALGGVFQKLAAPVLALIEHIQKWMEVVNPSQIDRIVQLVSKFGPAFALAAAGAAIFTANSLMGLPVVGQLLGNLTGPLKSVGGEFMNFGKAAVGMLPGLKGVGNNVGGLAESFGKLAGPIGIAVIAFGILMAVSPEFRRAVMDMVRAVMEALKPALDQILVAIRPLLPVIVQLAQTVGEQLARALISLTPLIVVLVQTFAQILAAGLPIIVSLLESMGSVVGIVLNVAVSILAALLVPLVPVISALATAFAWLLGLLQPLAPVITGLVIAWMAYQAIQTAIAAIQALNAIRWGIGIAQIYAETAATWLNNAAKTAAAVAAGLLSATTWAAVGAWIANTAAVAASTVATWAANAAQLVVRGATLLWTGAQWLLNAAMSANPIGLVILAIAALVVAIILIVRNLDWFKAAALAVWDALVKFAGWIWTGLKAAWDWIVGAARAVGDAIAGVARTIWEWITGLAGRLWSAASDAARALWSGFARGLGSVAGWVWNNIIWPFLDALRQLPGKLLDIGKDVARGLLNGIKDGLANIGEFVGNLIPGPIKKFLGIGSPSRVFMEIGLDSAAGLLLGLAAVTDPAATAVLGEGLIGGFVAGMKSSASQASDAFAGIVASMTAGGAGSETWAYRHTPAGGAGAEGAAAGGAVDPASQVAAMVTAVQEGMAALSAEVTVAMDGLLALVATAWAQINMTIAAALAAIIAAVQAALDQIAAYVTAVHAAMQLAVANTWARMVADTAGGLAMMWLLISGSWDGWLAYTAAVWGQIWLTIANTWAQIVADTAGAMAILFAMLAAGWTEIANIVAAACAQMVADTAGAMALIQANVIGSHDAIRAYMQGTWDAIASHVAARLADLVRDLTGALDMMSRATNDATSYIENTMRDAWNRIHDNARETWQRMVETIGRVWDGIKGAIRDPIKWVTDQLINKFIDGLNGLIEKVGEQKIPTISLGFARGGPVPGVGTGDTVPAMLTPGEWVLTRAQARAIGYQNLANLPHYQVGGLVGKSPKLDISPPFEWERWDSQGGDSKTIKVHSLAHLASLPASDLLDEFSEDKFAYDVIDALEKVSEPFSKALDGWDKHSSIFSVRWLAKTWPDLVESALDWFFDELCAMDMGGFGTGDWEGGAQGVQALAQTVMSRFPGMRISSSFRPGDPGYHGRGWARDLAGPAPIMAAAGAWMQQNMVGALLEGIHNAITGQHLSVKNYQAVSSGFWGGGTWAGHRDHIHMAADPNRTAPGAGGGSSEPGGRRAARQQRGQADFGGGMGAGDAGLPFGGSIANLANIARFFMGRGYSKNASAGIAGNIGQESGGNPLVSGTGGRGLIGWTPPSRLPESAWIPGNFALSMQRQLEQVLVYNQIWKQYIPRLNAAASAAEAAQIYCTYFERAGIPAMGNRVRWANLVVQRLAHGGVIREPVIGFGQRSGHRYEIAERGPERVSPLRNARADVNGLGAARPTVINVYPQPGQDERQIAAAVSRELAWAAATGAR